LVQENFEAVDVQMSKQKEEKKKKEKTKEEIKNEDFPSFPPELIAKK